MEPNVSFSGEKKKKFKGVRRRKWGRWVSEIRLPHSRERIWLGSYDSPEKAARAFDAASVCLRGPGGTEELNFPSSPPAVVGLTSDPDEVRAAAMSHADRVVVSAAAPRDATEPSVEVEAAVAAPPARALAPLQVPDEGSDDWPSRLEANLPPLYSPTLYVGSHAYTYLPVMSSLTAADDTEENGSASCPGLWSFDSSSIEGAVADQGVDDVQRNLTYASSSFPDDVK